MKLPENSIGISDVLAYRECPRRMSYGMRRHTAPGQQSDRAMPEALLYGAAHARLYGSAIHRVIELSEDGEPDQRALQLAWNEYGNHLDPSDLVLLGEDLETYHLRDFPGTETIAAEEDYRIPLFSHDGEMIFFRFKVDRLYRRLDAPETFIHVDYKSSKWPKSQQEVHEDLQLWVYNWGLHERFPEIENLLQFHDQLSYGQLPTRKGEAQRDQIRTWLEAEVRKILAADEVQDDGLLPHQFNEWCPWCPIIADCPVIDDLLDFSRTRIASLMTPKKRGETQELLAPGNWSAYTELYDEAKLGAKTLDAFSAIMSDTIRALPEQERIDAGYDLRSRTNSSWDPEAMRRIHERLGDRFFDASKLGKGALEDTLGDEPDLLGWALEQANKAKSTPSVVKAKEAKS